MGSRVHLPPRVFELKQAVASHCHRRRVGSRCRFLEKNPGHDAGDEGEDAADHKRRRMMMAKEGSCKDRSEDTREAPGALRHSERDALLIGRRQIGNHAEDGRTGQARPDGEQP